MNIPKRISFVWWQGLDKLPPEKKRVIVKWKKMNPDWTIYVFDRDRITKLIYHKFNHLYYPFLSLEKSKSSGIKFKYMRHVDFARPLIAEYLGGFVVDTDMIPNRKAEDFLNDKIQLFRRNVWVNKEMIDNPMPYTEPLDLNKKKVVMFYDFKAPDGKFCVAPGFIIAKPNNGLLRWFVEWCLKRTKPGDAIIDCFGPRAYKDFWAFALEQNSKKLEGFAILSHLYVWWVEDFTKNIGHIPDWVLATHRGDRSWCDKNLEMDWEAT